MNWLNSSGFRSGFTRQRTPSLDATTADPDACYASFKEHWQQAYKIIQRSYQKPVHDDVLGMVNHLEQMVTLLLYELKNRNIHVNTNTLTNLTPLSPSNTHTPCLEYLLSENLLDKIYEWGLRTGKYGNAVRLEQIKMYEMLINISSHELLVHEPFLRPLLKLLLSCQGECFPDNIVKDLVQLLYQLCVSLMQKAELLDLFFVSTPGSPTKFIIFSLLIPYVHTEGATGLQARDALLLCMSLSKKNLNIAEHSNVCPMLATGLSGLYSLLPRNIKIETEDWHRFTPDDVKDIKELALFMNSLEFCNAAAQVAHPIIKGQLLDFLYQGFLFPVLKPALLQADVTEQIASVAYLDLIMRSVSEPGLLPAMIRFLLKETINDVYLLEVLICRIDSANSFRLSLVTLALFETLVDLNCEDIMLELIFKHLKPCSHLMLPQRPLIIDTDTYTINMDKLFSLVPNCCRINNSQIPPAQSISSTRSSLSNGTSTTSATEIVTNNNSGAMSLPTNWNHYGTQVNDTLLGNYHAYLCDARQKITMCRQACVSWSSTYDCVERKFNTEQHQNNMGGDSLMDGTLCSEDLYDLDERTATNSLQSLGDSSDYGSFKYKSEENGVNSSKMVWKQSCHPPLDIHSTTIDKDDSTTEMCSSVGLFLNILLEKLSDMLKNNIYVNFHLTGLISRLAIYPQTLLQSYLLNYQLVLQPNVRSIFQVVGLLKHQIDEYMSNNADSDLILTNARQWLFERENKLLNLRWKGVRNEEPISTTNNQVARIEPNLSRSSSSLTNSVTSMLKRTSIGSNFFRKQTMQQNTSHNSNSQQSTMDSTSLHSSNNDTHSLNMPSGSSSTGGSGGSTSISRGVVDNVALCAILLDEWLKELAAISQEQTIAQLTDVFSKKYLH